jgi:hypothetical protein
MGVDPEHGQVVAAAFAEIGNRRKIDVAVPAQRHDGPRGVLNVRNGSDMDRNQDKGSLAAAIAAVLVLTGTVGLLYAPLFL